MTFRAKVSNWILWLNRYIDLVNLVFVTMKSRNETWSASFLFHVGFEKRFADFTIMWGITSSFYPKSRKLTFKMYLSVHDDICKIPVNRLMHFTALVQSFKIFLWLDILIENRIDYKNLIKQPWIHNITSKLITMY